MNWRRDDSEPEYQPGLLCDEWEVVVPELVFFLATAFNLNRETLERRDDLLVSFVRFSSSRHVSNCAKTPG